jgi:hypothetical protein
MAEAPTQATLNEAKRLMKQAENHERLVALREDSARLLEEQGEPAERVQYERDVADRERIAARDAWDRALALQGPTQVTEQGLEIPIPTREDFLRNVETVAKPRNST